jgi:RNA polymerase sigma-70 factor, ECF subfamily
MSQRENVCREEELALLSAVLIGEPGAKTEFFSRYNHIVEMCVRKILSQSGLRPTEEDVRDRVADIWLWLLDNDMHRLRRFDPNRNIRVATWIGLLTRNKTIDKLRTNHDRVTHNLVTGPLEDCPSQEFSPHDLAVHNQRVARLLKAIGALKQEEQQFLEAWYIDRLEPDELADRFGIAVGTVYSRRFKLQQKITHYLSRYRTGKFAVGPATAQAQPFFSFQFGARSDGHRFAGR